MPLNTKQISFLRAKAHALNVIVSVGAKGVSLAVKNEIDLALSKHELIKIKLPAVDKADKKAMLDTISRELKATTVQLIGRVGVLYRPADKPIIKFIKAAKT